MNLLKKLQSHPVISAVAAITVAVGAMAGATLAWGPDRETFTIEKPATYVTFNSITNNPAHGDERNFFQVKPADAPSSAYSDNIALEPGKEYQGYVYYHNDAAANLKLTAENTTMRVELPAVVNGSAKANAFVRADNAKPVQVFDDVTLTSQSAVALRMVPGSATIHSKGAVNGSKLADSLITSGVKLGYDALDGKLPGCHEFAGYVTFRFVADQPNFTVDKKVSKHGDNKWVESYSAQPGETVDFLLQYKNTGTTLQNNVVMKDELPNGMTYVAGSAKLGNPSNPGGVKTNDGVTTTGLNVGSYNPGQNAWIIFSAKLANESALKCGVNTLINKLTVSTSNGSKSGTAQVTVTKKCEEPVEKTIEVCRLEDKKYPVTIKESEFNSEKYSKNPEDCKEVPAPSKIEVCDLDSSKVIAIDEDKFDEDKHSKDLSKCDPDPTPEEPTKPEEPAKPETPAELPQTGLASSLVGIFGLGALTYTLAMYVASRRA